MKITEETRGLQVTIERFSWLEMRKILWRNGLSFQEFFSYLSKLLITGDKRLYDMLLETKVARAKAELPNIIHSDDESLYNIIAQTRLLNKEKQKKEEG